MKFVSYAQNFEDIILNRALSDVSTGFYLDVGAADPVEGSVTKAFYQKGWRGINIEPLDNYYKLIVKDRPEDINLNIAITDYNGTLDLFAIKERNSASNGLSTTNEKYAEHYRSVGFESEKITVSCHSLDVVLEKHKSKEIHFIKIDVEGCEKKVIEGLFLTKSRPWIMVIEATKPNTNIDVSFEWEHIILKNDYSFVYFDGLNKFYLAKEHSDLKHHFQSPVSCLDNFIVYPHLIAEQQLDALRKRSKWSKRLKKWKSSINKRLNFFFVKKYPQKVT